ncbi:protein kinase, putative [Trypanosoma cruzi]|nr:protein kinase, putative [Trypanosoma cruzi]
MFFFRNIIRERYFAVTPVIYITLILPVFISGQMHTALHANKILRQHMLYVSAPLVVEGIGGNAAATALQGGARGTAVNSEQHKFSRPILVDAKNYSVQHASKHLEAVEKSGSVKDLEILREALIVCCSSTQRFPLPQVTLAELLRIFHEHMQYHLDLEGLLAGDYILNSFSLFFACDRQEAFQRYTMPLVELGILRPIDANYRNLGKFEAARFFYRPPCLSDLHLLPFRESLSRFICIFCHKSCIEGGNELIYVSHSRWMFGPQPSAPDAKDSLSSPFSPFPEALRRGFLGPLMQFVTSFCIDDCKVHDAWGSDCCIVRLDGVKVALVLLSLNNTSLTVLNPEENNLDRCDCPTTVLFGFPEGVPDAKIRLALQCMFDVVEMREGPRVDFGVVFGQSPDEFRRWCRSIGNKFFYMTSDLFFNTQGSSCMSSLRPDWELISLPGTEKSRYERNERGFMSYEPHILNPLLRAAPLSSRAFALALDLRCCFERAISAKRTLGGCFAMVLLVGVRVILSDCHPYLTSLLRAEARLDNFALDPDLQLPSSPLADETFGGRDDTVNFSSLWSRVVCSNFRGSTLRLAWRYLPAHVVRLTQNETEGMDTNGLFYRLASVSTGDVTLVMLIGSGRRFSVLEGTEVDEVWGELEDVCLRELSEREHEMMILSSAVAECEPPQRFLDGDSREWDALCVSHDLTTGALRLLGQRGGGLALDNIALEPLFSNGMLHAQSLLGRPFCPPQRYDDDAMAAYFAFAELPVTRVVLGRTAFGGGRDRRSAGALYSCQRGGQELFFTENKLSTFRSVEDNFFFFLASQMGDGEFTI